MTVLTENDWKRLSRAMREMESIEMERIYAPLGLRVIAYTSPATGPSPVAMLVTIKGYFRGGEWHQHCESVEQAKEVLRRWNGWQ